MKFNQYRENTKRYLQDYYGDLKEQFKDRPRTAYSQLFELERAGINRYIKSQINIILIHIRGDLEERLSEEESEKAYHSMKLRYSNRFLPAIPYESKRAPQSERLIQSVRTDGGEKSEPKNATQEKIINSTAGGAFAGGISGYAVGTMLGKSPLLFSGIGAASGGIIMLLLASNYLAQEMRQKPVSNPTKKTVSPQNKTESLLSIDEILNVRQRQAETHILELIAELENNQKEFAC